MFKLWSETNKEAKDELRPDFGFRSWNELDADDKEKIWSYLWEKWFFDTKKDDFDAFFSSEEYTDDQKKDKSKKLNRISTVLDVLNRKYKAKVYARNFLDNRSIYTALKDFYSIYLVSTENVAFELLSIYAQKLIIEREDGLQQKEDESGEEFEKRNNEYKWEEFDDFSEDLNDLFDHFGIYVLLTRQDLIPKQDKKIIEDIYQPVLKMLSHDEYKESDDMIKSAFRNFRSGDFEKVIQNSINSMHAYLQIKISKKIGKGNFKTLLREAEKEKIIPSGELITNLYANIESFLARERKDKTPVHPSKGKSTSDDALFVLNLTMVVLQSFLSFKK